ncbi:outer membrane protein assembly factor BamB family protein [Streptomyces endophyticus]|uniref:PQQ-like beta-propeller repeat protein n=1 Tax=Streptomyces endophyticus TaxID=714166 RepID=A0ABU6FDQ1_9ACTN|nr:PQQ-binding-like beta-propeller repeat protein [Streptomyces endophyticus]MEB8342157.1 PQQ-like beta-propeller repeat protein [Streptomyces endophyticus]
MTQPPPPRPPNEPPSPQGRFGAPPPMPPYTAPGYGTLRTPLPPEARDRLGQQPYEQSQYEQPRYGPPQPPTRKKVPPIALVIGAAVVALALIVGGGFLYATRSGDDPGVGAAGSGGDKSGDGFGGAAAEQAPADPSAGVTLRLPAPKVAKRQVDSVQGSWLTDRTYAKAGVNQLVGYDAASGRKTWTLPLSGQTCAGTDTVTGDALAAVVSEAGKRPANGDHKPCSQITVFDVNTGHKLWTQSLGQGSNRRIFEELSLSGNTLAAGGGLDGGAAFDVKSGDILWQPDTGECQDLGYHGGAQLVTVRKCGTYGEHATYDVQLLDPVTGQPKWSYKLARGFAGVKVLSTKPVVFGVGKGTNAAGTITDIFALDSRGGLASRISIDPKKYDFACEVGKTEDCAKITVGNGRIYFATRPHGSDDGTGPADEIVSYSLETGKRTGDRVTGGDHHDIFPVRMDGGNILAFKTGAADKGSQIVTIDPHTLKQSTLVETPATPAVRNMISAMAPGRSNSELRYSKGRLFLGQPLIGEPYADGGKRYTAIGFGTG